MLQPGRRVGLQPLPFLGRLGICLAALLLGATDLSAHDLWIEPSESTPQPGRPVVLRLRIGDRFEGDPMPRRAGAIVRFSVLTPAGERPLAGVEGVDPAGFFTPSVDGWHWVVYESRPRRLTLAADRFERHLREEGLERIMALREARSESSLPGRESYRRCAKTLLEVGAPEDPSQVDRLAGCTLELALDSAPREVAASGALGVRALFRGRPLSGALVAAMRKGDPGPPLAVRTDESGRALLPVERSGLWLLKTVHMEPAAEESGQVDWQSWWASLTVRLADGPGTREP